MRVPLLETAHLRIRECAATDIDVVVPLGEDPREAAECWLQWTVLSYAEFERNLLSDPRWLQVVGVLLRPAP